MTTNQTGVPTTYVYEPLLSDRHIRLLHIERRDNSPTLSYSLVQHKLPISGELPHFEAISYTWGEAKKVSSLVVTGESAGQIGLTANLTEALPCIALETETKRVWIDQICVNQADNDEKAVQIKMMSDVYKKATRVIVWLGLEDDNVYICKEWLEAIAKLIPTLERANKTTPGHPDYHADTRGLFLKSTFNDPATDSKFAPAIQAFWQRPWFTRGWICQEFLLARSTVILTGNIAFTLQDLVDMLTVPESRNNAWMSYRCLMYLKMFPFTDPAPLRHLRVMFAIAGEFDTKEVVDRLFGCLGLMDGINFKPDYSLSTKHNFTRFAVALAQDYGSLDFLSLWAANLDPLVKITPEEVLGLPSWVPSWTAWPLQAPFRLATGGARNYRHEVSWNASGGKKHVHDQEEDAVTTGRLHVRGYIVDHIESIASTKFDRYWDVDKEYIDSLANQLKAVLSGLENWTHRDLIHFLNIAAANGGTPLETAEELLSTEKHAFRDLSGLTEGLGICLSMGRGRRFMRTEQGRLGLAPAIGSKARSEGRQGSVIALVDGCSVPVVLEAVDKDLGHWTLIGDCYIEGIMLGEVADREGMKTETLILV